MGYTELCQKNCIGCGLCHSELHTEMQTDSKGFLKPVFKMTEEEEAFLQKVCPSTGCQIDYLESSSIWGRKMGVYAGFSADPQIREKASSGGMLTALAIFLLESHKVDAIVQVRKTESDPTETECCICQTTEEVKLCCGSRYAISSPWLNLSSQIQPDKTYAAIGKPCDIAALRNLRENCGKYENILYLLSFFCAGLPSADANNRLLSSLGCPKDSCVDLTYRGNGWPGKATAVDRNGNLYRMDYAAAWGGILGRDIHPYCRVCIDGIGEAADLSCGDGWYISPEGKVDFSEREGRNVVFSRTKTGEALLQEAAAAGAVVLHPWESLSDLEIIQNYQFTRRSTMWEKIIAYKLFLRKTPRYPGKIMTMYGKHGSFKVKFRVFAGTAKRILKKKL